MTISDLRTALRQHWLVAVVPLLVWLVLGAGMAFLPAPTYTSSAVVVVNLPPSGATDAVQYAAFQIPVLGAAVESHDFIAATRGAVPPSVADADVTVTTNVSAGTGVVRIGVSSHHRDATAPWATALAKQAVASEQGRLLSLRLLQPAIGPGTRTSSNRVPVLLAAGVLGLMSAVLAAVIALRLRRALDVGPEIEARLGLPVLGAVPRSSALRRSGAAARAAVGGKSSDPAVVEAFKALRTALELRSPGGLPAALAVTGLVAGQGASTVAAALAITTAESGISVLGVDADLRLPTLDLQLAQRPGRGLADALQRDIETLVIPTGIAELTLLRAGTPDRHPADIAPFALEEVIVFAKEHGQHVIVDAPPLEGRAETPAILAAAISVLVVVDARRIRLDELERATDSLRDAGVALVGVVLNRGRSPRWPRSRRTLPPAPLSASAATPPARAPLVATDARAPRATAKHGS